MRKLSYLFLITILYSCSYQQPFFNDFDQIEYYHLKNDSLIDYNKKSDSLTLKIYNEDYPIELENEKFYQVINGDKFSKHVLSEIDLEEIRKIFRKKVSFVVNQYACVPNYRDILLFKRKGEISGIAKICIECEKHHFVGNNKSIQTSNFGANDEFSELKKIFKNYTQYK